MEEKDFGEALVDLYEEVKDRDTVPPEHTLVRIYENYRLKGWKPSKGIVLIGIEEIEIKKVLGGDKR